MCAPGISNSIYLQKASWDELCDGSFVEWFYILKQWLPIIKYKAFIYCCSPPFPFLLVIVNFQNPFTCPYPLVARHPSAEISKRMR
ncbi:hypothetical protein OIU84_006614 [Salix udensis]|uniref:Uncharacterized protein n=1 Tax=Salix udensis TaxID=889485 RepID=A0AAD6JYY1_9ROSI|nr:hypothetical protein OIU84_006614 [Salix udensis]